MKFYRWLYENSAPSNEMVDFYEKRTREHIHRVSKNLSVIAQKRKDLNRAELLRRGKIHDKSKYLPKEYEPYIWLTWWHKEKNAGRKFEYPSGMEEKVRKATKHHITSNPHHPEYHNSPKDMSNIDIAEMVADWAAMSQELGDSLKKWADNNVNKKWHFTKEQTKLIYDLVELF